MRAIDARKNAATFSIPLEINSHRPVNRNQLPRADWDGLAARSPLGTDACGQSMSQPPARISRSQTPSDIRNHMDAWKIHVVKQMQVDRFSYTAPRPVGMHAKMSDMTHVFLDLGA